MWKKRMIQVLWITTGVALVVLLGAAMKQKNHKVCREVKIEISGAEEHMFMDEKDILHIVNASGNVVGKDVSTISLQQMETELEMNAWVKNAELFFNNQQVLTINIQERQPIARIFTVQGSSFYLDTAGVHLPLSEKLSARVPVITNFPSDKKVLAKGDSLVLQQVIQLSKYIVADSFWMAQIAQVDVTPSANFELVPVIGNHIISIGDATALETKLNRLFTFYKEAWLQNGMSKYERLDVRYNNQIVATKRGMGGIKADTAKALQIVDGLTVPLSDSTFNGTQTNRIENKRDTAKKISSTNRIESRRDSAKKVNNNKPVQTNNNKPINTPKPSTPKPVKQPNTKPRAIMSSGN